MAGFLSGQFGDNPFYQGFDQRRNAISQFGLGLMQGKTLQEGLTAGVGGAIEGRKQDDAYAKVKKDEDDRLSAINETAAWLQNKAQTDPAAADFAALIDAGTMTPYQAVTAYYAQQPKADGATQDWSRLNDGTLYNQRTGETQAVGGAGGSITRSTQPLYGKDANGNTVVLQLGDDGTGVQTQFPNGITPFGPDELNSARASGTADGKTAAGARASLPSAEQAYDLTAQTLDRLTANKGGADDNFGSTFFYPNQNMEPRPGTARANMKNDLEQLSGQAFLTMRQTLKGAGQVTDYEGAKAEAALTVARGAFERGDKPAFDQALKDYKAAVENGMRLLRLQANDGYSAGAPAVTGAPAASSIVDAADYFK